MRNPLIAAFVMGTVSLVPPLVGQARAEEPRSAADQAAIDRFSVVDAGSGPDVILIPGMATPRDVWDPNVSALKDHYTVHAVQIAGFGDDAGANAEGPVLDPLVDQLATYIRQSGIDRPAIVGHSLGGLIAMKLAAEHPDLPGRLMVVDALPWFGVLAAAPGSMPDMATIRNNAEAMRSRIQSRYGKAIPEEQLEAELAGQVLDPEMRTRLARWAGKADQRVVGQLVYEDLTTDMRERIADITVPVTVTYAWNETFPRAAQAAQFYAGQYAALDGITFRPIGPAAHFLMLDRPEDFQAALEEFLKPMAAE